MQFEEGKSKTALCPVCKVNKVPIRTTRGQVNYCGRACASQSRFATRYQGSMSGPLDRPSLKDRTKLK